MNRNNIIDGIAVLIATTGADDARQGYPINPEHDQYWYRVGYYIARDSIEPEVAMEMAGKDFPLE